MLILFILLAGWTAFYNLLIHYDASASLGAGFALLFTFIAFAILVLEQAIVYYINPKKKAVWIVELLLIVALIVTLYVTNFEFSVG